MFNKPAPPVPPPSPPPARRVTDTIETPATVIGPSIRIQGDLAGGDSIDLAGRLEGSCQVTGLCRMRETACVAGNVTATNLVIEGEVSAETLVAEKIEIGVSARVRGNLRARVVAIAEGAYFDGQVHMEGRDDPTTRMAFKEKRKGS